MTRKNFYETPFYVPNELERTKIAMNVCRECYESFSAVHAHVKVHGFNWESYKDKHHPELLRAEKAAILLKNLYCDRRWLWLYQNMYKKKASYVTVDSVRNYKENVLVKAGCREGRLRRSWGLTERDFLEHLKGNVTLGVCFWPHKNRFIGIDIDYNDINIMYKVYDILLRIFPASSILCSYSGGKGFHVDAFFQKMTDVDVIKKIWEYVIREIQLSPNKIELRGATTQGYKIPMGIHKGTGNYCYLIDMAKRDGTPIYNELEALSSVKRFDGELFIPKSNKPFVECKHNEEKLMQKKDYLDYIDEDCKVIEKKTRNTCAWNLAINWRANLKLDEEEIFNKLIAWHDSLDKNCYETERCKAIEEYESIAIRVCENDLNLKKPREASLTREELNDILELENSRRLMNLYLAIIRHAKIYADENTGEFYMTYRQMNEATGGSELADRSYLKKQVEKLIEKDRIEETKPPKFNHITKKSSPRHFRLLTVDHLIMGEFRLCNGKCRDCFESAANCMMNEKEICEHFKNRETRKRVSKCVCLKKRHKF